MDHSEFTYPPNKDKAERHRLACRIFKGADQKQAQLCECCDRKIGETQVDTPCSIQPTQFSFLGPGAPLFFLFLRYATGLFAIMVVIFVGFSVVSNLISSDCSSANSCIGDTFTLLSIINKQSNVLYLSIQSYMSLGFVLVTILFFHFFRYKARQLQEQCDEIINSPSDYAIILRRLPENTAQSDILQSIQAFKKDLIEQGSKQAQKIKVIKVILSYNLRQYNQTKEENIQQFHLAVKQQRFKQFKPKQLVIPTQTSRIAIVIFQLQETKELFIYKPNIGQAILKFFCTACTPLSMLTVKGQRVGVQRAPQPDEICWENSGITMKGSICRKLLYGTIGIIILLAGGAIQYALQLLSISTQDPTTKSLLGILSSVLVTIFNAIILITLQITTKKERAQTLTQFQTSLMVKITLAQFFNAGVFVIIAQIAANHESFTVQSSNIMSQISLIMILDAVIPNAILFFLNYFQMVQKVKRFLVQKNLLIASQKQLNQLYTSPEIDLPSKYAYILKTIWLTGLYSPMIPIVVVIALIGLLVNYFIQKLLFTKCYSIPNTISNMAFQTAVQLLEYFLITFSIGQFIIYAYFYNYQVSNIPIEWTVTIFLTIALAILNSALPMEAINQKIFPLQGSAKSQLKYSQAENSFQVTYEMSNPAYKTSRKRKQNSHVHGYSSIKNKQKNEEIELKNLMVNQALDSKNNVNQSLLKDFVKKDTIIQKKQSEESQSSDIYSSLSAKSATVVEESQKQKKIGGDSSDEQDKSKSKKPKQSQQEKKRQLKSNFFVQTLIPLESQEIESLKFYLRKVGHSGFKNPNKITEEQKLRKKQENKRLKKQRDAYYIEKALAKYNFVDIKNIKGKKKWDYQVPAPELQSKEKELKKQDSHVPRQSVLAMNPKQTKKQLNIAVNDNYKQLLGDRSSSLSERQMGVSSSNKKSALFNDPVSQKKSIYNPINLQTNYETFFNDVQAMKSKQGHYLNNKYVTNFLGTPFSSLLKNKKKVSLAKKIKQSKH